MKKLNIKNLVWKEGDSYVAWNLNTSISSFGSTKKRALDNLKEAMELYLEDGNVKDVLKIGKLDVIPSVLEYA